MVRLIIIAAIVAALGSGAAWAVSTASENERLSTELTAAAEANTTYINAITVMEGNIKQIEAALLERSQKARTIQTELNQTKRRLIDAQNVPAITVIEQQCMDSAIPVSILNVLRETGDHLPDKPTSKAMPFYSPVRVHTSPDITGINLVGSSRIRSGIKISYSPAEYGPRNNKRFLQ